MRERWWLLPPESAIFLALRPEAVPEGGVRQVCRLLLTGAGWLADPREDEREPVVRAEDEARALAHHELTDALAYELEAAPEEAPPRPFELAEVWGLGAALRDQLALLGAEPHCLRADETTRRLDVLVAPGCSVLWLAPEGIERVEVDWLSPGS